jgi:hypothetical protein
MHYVIVAWFVEREPSVGIAHSQVITTRATSIHELCYDTVIVILIIIDACVLIELSICSSIIQYNGCSNASIT